MGRTVWKSGQIDKSQSLVLCALERQQDLYDIIITLEAFANDTMLSGKAYNNAKEYVQNILLPINKALCLTIGEEAEANKKVIGYCNEYLSGVDRLDEEALNSEIYRLQERVASLQDEWWEYLIPCRYILKNNIWIKFLSWKINLKNWMTMIKRP